jgi:hypothetical protein
LAGNSTEGLEVELRTNERTLPKNFSFFSIEAVPLEVFPLLADSLRWILENEGFGD